MGKIKIVVIGTGHLGSIHCKLLKSNPVVDFIGVYDVNTELARTRAVEYETVVFKSIDDAIKNADAVIIVTPTVSHYSIAMQCITNGKHCFIEKPVTSGIKQAQKLIELANKNPSLKVQVGHIERFNPAIQTALKYNLNPMFIEAHRLSQFRPRATDVSVIHDLMIHDIDIVMWLVKSKVKKIDANGLSVITNTVDIANARIQFENGAVANLTASRLSANPLRKIRFFQRFGYISIDMSKPDLDVFRLAQNDENLKNAIPASMLGAIENFPINEMPNLNIVFEKPEIMTTNAMVDEHNSFIKSIQEDTEPLVTIKSATIALEVAEKIIKQINKV
jgi:predicted dehydrogenase